MFNDNVTSQTFVDYLLQGQGQYTVLHQQPYYESMMVRLYKFHGSAVQAQPVVVDYDLAQAQNGQTVKVAPQNGTLVKRFDTMQAARQFVQEDGSARIGGVGDYPSEDVAALENYRVVKVSQSSAAQVPSHNQVLRQRLGLMPDAQSQQNMLKTSPSWVKTFERVDGAKVEGTGPSNTTITASVEMETAKGTFTYRQQAETGQDGSFTMTLPYSTTGYDQWGTEKGYTNVSVRALGPYEFKTPTTAGEDGFTFQNATAQVSEGQVVGENGSPVTVAVDDEQVIPVQGANDSTAGNATTGPANETTDATGGDNSTVDDNSTAGGNDTTNSSGTTSTDSASDLEPPSGASTATRAGLVGSFAAAMLVARRD